MNECQEKVHLVQWQKIKNVHYKTKVKIPSVRMLHAYCGIPLVKAFLWISYPILVQIRFESRRGVVKFSASAWQNSSDCVRLELLPLIPTGHCIHCFAACRFRILFPYIKNPSLAPLFHTYLCHKRACRWLLWWSGLLRSCPSSDAPLRWRSRVRSSWRRASVRGCRVTERGLQ